MKHMKYVVLVCIFIFDVHTFLGGAEVSNRLCIIVSYEQAQLIAAQKSPTL